MRIYTAPDKLAQAYHEAVRGLSADQRSEFDQGLYAAYPELPQGILSSVINSELRTNPPLRAEPAQRTGEGRVEKGVAKAYRVFKKAYNPADRGTLAVAYREAVKGLLRSEREEFDDALYRVTDVPDDILTSLINEEFKSNPPKDGREQREQPSRRQRQDNRSKQRGRLNRRRSR